jgi:5-(carboxyamino)imidazole ribonucleotide mutase
VSPAIPPDTRGKAGVLLLVGSPSDLGLALEAEETLGDLGIPSRVQAASAHRTPDEAAEYARNAEADGFWVIIAFAGLAAHLAGVTAAHSLLPVIGVPVSGGPLSGLDAALSTLQMPPGTPVGAVAIDGARNAALLAARILARGDPDLRERLSDLRDRENERYRPERIEADLARRRSERKKGKQ